MRINGFTQIKAFYSKVFANEHPFKPQHIALYIFLVNQNNRNNWIEWFKCPFDLAMGGSCINSKKTYYRCLNELKDWRLINYKKGVNEWKAPEIKLEVLKDTSTIPQSTPPDTPLGVPQGIPTPKLLGEQLTTLLHTHRYKPLTLNLLTFNLKPITENIEAVCEFLESENLKTKNGSGDSALIDLPDDLKENPTACSVVTQAEQSILLLNDLAGTKYPASNMNFLRLVNARIEEYGFEYVKKVIELKVWQTKNRQNGKFEFQRKWLAPTTIFEQDKFTKYIEEVRDIESGTSQRSEGDKFKDVAKVALADGF